MSKTGISYVLDNDFIVVKPSVAM